MKVEAMHSHDSELLQHAHLRRNSRQKRGDQYALEKLRSSTGVPSRKKSYDERELGVEGSHSSPLKRPRVGDIPLDRFSAVRERVNQKKKPKRFDLEQWLNFRNESLKTLSPFYPNTNLQVLITWIETHSKPPGSRPLSAQKILDVAREMFPYTEIATHDEMSQLMKALAFKWGHLHSSYYIRLSRRPDVIAHRFEVIPTLHAFMTHPAYFYVNTDWSFEYENDISKSAWISLAQEGSDLVDSKPGKGKRLSFCEFLTRNGVLRHSDGKSAGTILKSNQILAANDILQVLRRGFEAIANHPEVRSGQKIGVLHLDGARNQTTKDSDYINPNEMNLSDAGANRVSMKNIGIRGLKSVLVENNQWSEDMKLADARAKLWGSRMVRDQLSQVEKLGKQFGVIVVYNPKAHPWLSFIEKLWRFVKMELQNVLNLREMRSRYEDLIGRFLEGSEFARTKCTKWHQLSLKYLEYYSRGGTEIVKEPDMKKLDLSKLPRPPPKSQFRTFEEAFRATHNANFILFRGKNYSPVASYW